MPAPAVIICPLCQSRFKGKPELGGKKIKCPSCEKPFVVPNEDAPAPPPKPKPKPAKVAVAAPDDDAAYGVTSVDTTYRCPHCAEEMLSADAVICVHCGYNTLTRQQGETKKLYTVTRQEHFMYLVPALSAAGVFVGLIIAMIFYDTVVPSMLAGSGMSWITHESLRMWTTLVLLALLWAIGTFAFRVLVMAPRPPDVEKE